MNKQLVCCISIVALFLTVFSHHAVASANAAQSTVDASAGQVIVPVSISLTAKGNMLDFRYRITDEAKARELLNHKNKPYLMIESDGTKTGVLKSPKLGSLRTTRPHETGRGYFMLFGNPERKLKSGDLVTIVIGDYKAEHLRVK